MQVDLQRICNRSEQWDHHSSRSRVGWSLDANRDPRQDKNLLPQQTANEATSLYHF